MSLSYVADAVLPSLRARHADRRPSPVRASSAVQGTLVMFIEWGEDMEILAAVIRGYLMLLYVVPLAQRFPCRIAHMSSRHAAASLS